MVGYDEQVDPPYELQQYSQDAYNMQNVYYDEDTQNGQEEPCMTLIVPERAEAGMKLRCTTPDGQELRLTVPEGVAPGSIMTLTQDLETKQWTCMAEPIDDPLPPGMLPEEQNTPHEFAGVPSRMPLPPSTEPGQPVRNSLTPQLIGGTWPSAGMTGPCMPAPNTAGPRFTGIRRKGNMTGSQMGPTYAQPMPVNLSYVPTPAQMQMNMTGAPSRQGLPMNSGPMPQAVAGTPFQHQGMMPPPAAFAGDPAMFNPARQQPTIGLPQEQRASYTAPPMQAVERRPSYSPPAPQMERRPSFSPLPQVTTAVERRPSYTPPPVSVVERKPSFTPVPQLQGAVVPQSMNGLGQVSTMTQAMGVNPSLTASTAGLPMRHGSMTMPVPSPGASISMSPQPSSQQAAMMYRGVGVPQQIMQQQQVMQPYATGVAGYNSVNQMPPQGMFSNPGFRPQG